MSKEMRRTAGRVEGDGRFDWEYFVAFLVMRIRYYLDRSTPTVIAPALEPKMASVHARWLKFALAHRTRFVA
jgi:hypothetical protein